MTVVKRRPVQVTHTRHEAVMKVNLKDEFTKMKMLEGRYRPSNIYPEMSEEVQKEFEEWLQQKKAGQS